GHIELGDFFELLLLAVGHHTESHVQHVFGGDAGLIRERNQFAVNTDVRIVAHLEVKVGGFALHGNSKQIINMHISLEPKKPGVEPNNQTFVALMWPKSTTTFAQTQSGKGSKPVAKTSLMPASKAFTFSSVRRLRDGYNVTDDTARQ